MKMPTMTCNNCGKEDSMMVDAPRLDDQRVYCVECYAILYPPGWTDEPRHKIETTDQYRVTRDAIKKLSESLAVIHDSDEPIHPLLKTAHENSYSSMLEELQAQAAEYNRATLYEYLTPGVEYDHHALKALYYTACGAFQGTALRLGVEQAYADGLVTMPTADFLHDAIAAYPLPNKIHPIPVVVPGVLVLLSEPPIDADKRVVLNTPPLSLRSDFNNEGE